MELDAHPSEPLVRRAPPIGPWLLVAWALLLPVALISGLAGPDLIDPDEGRNAEIAREMAQSGDYLLPRLNGLPFLDKPMLYFAASAAAMQVVGPGELAARLPAFLCALLLAGLTAGFAGYLFGRRAAWIAGIASLVSPLMIAFSRIAIFDTMLSLFIVLALIAFYRAVEAVSLQGHPTGVRPRLDWPRLGWPRLGPKAWTVLAWLAMAAGVLTKGPVALAVPLLVAVPFAAWRKASRAVWHPMGPLAFLVLIVPWIAAVQHREPGFLHYALVVETWNRLTTDEMQRTGPLWYFVPYLLGGAFPWSVVAAIGWFRSGPRKILTSSDRVKWIFLILWLTLPLLLFSLSQSKRPQYILPLIPCLALAVAGLWSRPGRQPGTRPTPRLAGQRTAAAVFLLAGTGLLLASAALPSSSLGVEPSMTLLARVSAIGLALACLAGGLLGWRARTWSTALVGLSLPVAAFPLVVAPLFGQVAEDRSSRRLAEVIERHQQEATSVAVLEKFPHSLPFYLRRKVDFASRDGIALRSGYVERSYEEQLAREGTTLRRHSWWTASVGDCAASLLFVLPKKYADEVAALEAAGHPRLGGDGKFLVFGSCERLSGTTLAEREAAMAPEIP